MFTTILEINTGLNENLKQGKILLNNRKKNLRKNEADMKLIEETSGPNIGYLIEGAQNMGDEVEPTDTLLTNFTTDIAEYKTEYLNLITALQDQYSSSNWTKCADQNSDCSGVGIVKYGANDTWKYIESSGNILCNDSTIGELNAAGSKECYILNNQTVKDLFDTFKTNNAALLVSAQSIRSSVGLDKVTDATIEAEILQLETNRDSIINSLDSISKEGMANNGSENPAHNINLANIKQDSKFKLDSNQLKYFIWLMVTVLLIFLSFYTFNSTSQSIFVQLIIGSIAVYILYQLALYIHI